MTSSEAERPVLTAEQKLELNYLKLTWDRFYDITYNGARWSATPKGTREVLHADSKAEMNTALMLDATVRTSRPSRSIEAASSAPFPVPSPE
jgi:hypothetical protein